MHDLVREVFHGHLRSIIGSMSVEDLIANRNELAQATRDASRGRDAEARPRHRLAADPGDHRPDRLHPRARRAARGRGQDARAHRGRRGRPRGDRARAGGRGAEGRRPPRLARSSAPPTRRRSTSRPRSPRRPARWPTPRRASRSSCRRPRSPSSRPSARRSAWTRRSASRPTPRPTRSRSRPRPSASPASRSPRRRPARSSSPPPPRRSRSSRSATPRRASRPRAASPRARRRKAKGEAEGASIRAKGLAEAEAIAKRAEALEKEADAVIGQQIAEQLPEIVRAAAESFKHVDNLTVLNGAQGISEIIAQVIGQAGPALEMAQAALAALPLQRRREGSQGRAGDAGLMRPWMLIAGVAALALVALAGGQLANGERCADPPGLYGEPPAGWSYTPRPATDPRPGEDVQVARRAGSKTVGYLISVPDPGPGRREPRRVPRAVGGHDRHQRGRDQWPGGHPGGARRGRPGRGGREGVPLRAGARGRPAGGRGARAGRLLVLERHAERGGPGEPDQHAVAVPAREAEAVVAGARAERDPQRDRLPAHHR